jgi:hypothetical protein
LLFTDITILEVLESESNQELENSKSNRVDIKVTDSEKRILIIEIQYSRELDYLQRILFASSKVISEHLPKGAAIRKSAKSFPLIFCISILAKAMIIFITAQPILSAYTIKLNYNSVRNKNAYIKSEKIADIYPEYYLIEIRNFNDIAKDTLDEWIYFLKNETR